MPGFWTRFDIRRIGRRAVTVLLVWLVLNLGFMLLFVRPRVEEYKTLKEQSQPRLDALSARKSEVESKEAFLAALEKAQDDMKVLRTEWLGTRGRQMVPIQLELSRLAEQFNIDLREVQYQNSELEEEELERFAMVVPLEAGYGSLRKFLQAVETSSRFLVVERVALGQGTDGGVLLKLNITLATYFDAPHIRAKKTNEERRRRQIERERPPRGRA